MMIRERKVARRESTGVLLSLGDVWGRRFRHRTLAASLTILVLFHREAASATDAAKPQAPLPKWELGIGLSAFTVPDYIGSDESGYFALPFPYFVYRGEKWKVDREALRGKIFSSERLSLDVSMSGSLPVDSEDNRARKGMEDLNLVAEIGPNLRYLLVSGDLGRVWLEFPVRSVFDTDFTYLDHTGWITTPGVRWMRELAGISFDGRAALQFGDNGYHGYFYGVPIRDVTATRPEYEAKTGYSGLRLAFGGSRRWGRFWLGAFVRYANVDGATFEGSPLVETDHGVTAGFGVAWVAFESKETVASDAMD